MTTIKIKTFKFISVRPIHYIILTLVIFVVVLCTAVTIANTIQLSMFISDAQELRHEVAILRSEQKHISAQIEGQALATQKPPSELAFQTAARKYCY